MAVAALGRSGGRRTGGAATGGEDPIAAIYERHPWGGDGVPLALVLEGGGERTGELGTRHRAVAWWPTRASADRFNPR